MRHLALAVLIAGALIAPAQAATPTGDWQHAVRTAQSAFTPVCSTPTVTVSRRVQPGQDALTYPTTCRVLIAPWWKRWSRAKLCTVMVHEYGHLAGLGHSTDPTSVMYATYRHPWSGCSG